MGILTSLSLDEVRLRGSIKDSDVLRMRRALSDDVAMTADDADALMVLNASCPIKDPSWAGFFADAISDYAVHQAKPEGYVEAGKATWLIDRIARTGRIDSHAELTLLLTVLEKARWSPPSLVRLVMEQVRLAVATGSGPLRSGQLTDRGAITESDIALVRRALVAFAGEAGIAVTRDEADTLVEINAAIAPGKSSPAWTELFVKAVGNAVLASLGHATPARAEALREETWVDHADASNLTSLLREGLALEGVNDGVRAHSGDLMGRMIAGGSARVWSSLRALSPEERALTKLERQRLEIITRESIAEAEETWLVARLDGKSPLDDNEMALLAFVEREATVLPAPIKALAAKARIAA